MQQGIGIQYQRRAKRIEKEICTERIRFEIKERMFEPPMIPNIAIFVQRPSRRARNMAAELGGQRIGYNQGNDKIEQEDNQMSSRHVNLDWLTPWRSCTLLLRSYNDPIV